MKKGSELVPTTTVSSDPSIISMDFGSAVSKVGGFLASGTEVESLVRVSGESWMVGPSRGAVSSLWRRVSRVKMVGLRE